MSDHQSAQPTIDSELDEILHNVTHSELFNGIAKAKLTNLIAQEANKAVVAEFTMLLAHPRVTTGNLIPVSCVLDRIEALTVDKESNNE